MAISTGERRDEILNIALCEFAVRGFVANTMEGIAEKAGFTKPILYNHFINKQAIYEEIMSVTASRILDSLARATSSAKNPRGIVETAFRVYFDLLVSETPAFRFLFLHSHESEMASQLRVIESQMTSFIEDLISVDLDGEHRRQLSAAVVGMAEGAAISWLVQQESLGWPTPPTDSAEVLASRIATFAWGGLRAVTRS
jgi:hypothetical protein